MKFVTITCERCGKQEMRAPRTRFCFECKKAHDREKMREYQAKRRAEKRNENR